MVKIKWILLIIVAVLLLTSPYAKTEFFPDGKETLRGIKAIFVVIDPILLSGLQKPAKNKV